MLLAHKLAKRPLPDRTSLGAVPLSDRAPTPAPTRPLSTLVAADATLQAFKTLHAFGRLLPHALSATPLTVTYALGAIRNQCLSLDEVTLLSSHGVLDRLQELAGPRGGHAQAANPLDHPRLRQFAAGCLINVRQILQASEQAGSAAPNL